MGTCFHRKHCEGYSQGTVSHLPSVELSNDILQLASLEYLAVYFDTNTSIMSELHFSPVIQGLSDMVSQTSVHFCPL